MEFNHPLIVQPATFHGGDAPPSQGWLSCGSPNVVVSSVRPAQDGIGWIVQLVEMDGLATEALIAGDFSSVEVVDSMERRVGRVGTKTDAGWTVPIRANGMESVRVVG
jgi:hypothetical protein